MSTPSPFNRNTVREPRLGAIISDDPGTHDRRDAVHNAVVPLRAMHVLRPGQRIGITVDEEHADPATDSPIGIVDPFLTEPVKVGERFWLFIFPGQVTTLRHEWTHPAFKKQTMGGVNEDQRAESEKWLRAYAINFNHYDSADGAYLRLMNGLRDGDVMRHGSHLNGADDLEDGALLKHHAQIVLGVPLDFDAMTFRCSC